MFENRAPVSKAIQSIHTNFIPKKPHREIPTVSRCDFVSPRITISAFLSSILWIRLRFSGVPGLCLHHLSVCSLPHIKPLLHLRLLAEQGRYPYPLCSYLHSAFSHRSFQQLLSLKWYFFISFFGHRLNIGTLCSVASPLQLNIKKKAPDIEWN